MCVCGALIVLSLAHIIASSGTVLNEQ